MKAKPGMKNVYHTSDPEVLLNLKRMEADAIRDVLRSVNRPEATPTQIFKICQNVLLAQLSVKKMMFIYKDDNEYLTGFKLGFPAINPESQAELPGTLQVIRVKQDEHPALYEMGVENVISVQYRKLVAAWVLVSDFSDSERERENDLIFIETLANVISAFLENRYLVRELVQQETMRQELQVAGKIQQQLLSDDFSEVIGGEVAAYNRPHSTIGGDFYDVIPRGKLGFFVIIADVAGKGIGAALLMANLQAQLRALILSQNNLFDLIRKLHEGLIKITEEQFVTLFIAHVRIQERKIDYINAGHNAPILLNKEGMNLLEKGTIPLGIIDLPHIEQGEISFGSGDMLFLYTDGLVEQQNAKGEFFGEDRIKAGVSSGLEKKPQTLIDEMIGQYEKFAERQPQADDVTVLAVKFL